MADEFSFADLGDSAEFTPSYPSGLSLSGGESAMPALPSLGRGISTDTMSNISPEKSGFSDLAGGALKGIKDYALPGLQLATGGMGIYSGIQGAKQAAESNKIARQGQKLQQEAATATRSAAAPLTQFGQQQLTQAEGGQIPPAIQAKINDWKQGYLATVKDHLAKIGQGDSQTLMQWTQWIEQQAKAMEASYLQQEMQLGVQGLQSGASALGSAGQQAGAAASGATNQSRAIENLMEEANRTLSRLTASSA